MIDVMRTYRFLVIVLALSVGLAGFNVDAQKRKTKRRAANAKVVEPAPYGYDYVVGTDATRGDGEVLDMCKYPPEYPGGVVGLVNFLNENIKYPSSAKKKGIAGRVVLQFVVEKDGSTSNIKVLRSVDKDLDAEAVRVVKQIKRFVPGYNDDHVPVRVLYTLPVSFKLD